MRPLLETYDVVVEQESLKYFSNDSFMFVCFYDFMIWALGLRGSANGFQRGRSLLAAWSGNYWAYLDDQLT